MVRPTPSNEEQAETCTDSKGEVSAWVLQRQLHRSTLNVGAVKMRCVFKDAQARDFSPRFGAALRADNRNDGLVGSSSLSENAGVGQRKSRR